MYPLIKLFFEIAILRKGPQDIPSSVLLLRLIILIYVVTNLLSSVIYENISTALSQILIDFALLTGFCWPLLKFANKAARFPQTLCALLGTDIIITFCAIPISASQNSLLILILVLWHWLAYGHIFRHALDKPLFFGLGLAFLYRLISVQAMALLFPAISSQT